MRFLLAILLLLLAAPASAQQGQGMSKALVVSSCGGGTLPAGPVTNLTMNPQGQLCLVGISGGGGCAEAMAYLARATGETTHASDLTTLICGLVTDGVWSKLDTLYLPAQQTEADAELNLIGTSYTLTPPVFGGLAPAPLAFSWVAYQGYIGNGSNQSLITGFNATTAPSPHFVQNSADIGVWIYSGGDGGIQIGTGSTFGDASLTANISSTFYCFINYGSGSGSTASPGTTGFFGCDTPNSTTATIYWNNSNLVTQAAGTQAPNNVAMVIAKATLSTISEAHIGASLGAAGTLALYNRLRTYMTAVGVP